MMGKLLAFTETREIPWSQATDRLLGRHISTPEGAESGLITHTRMRIADHVLVLITAGGPRQLEFYTGNHLIRTVPSARCDGRPTMEIIHAYTKKRVGLIE